ncbi:MAG: ABC transporter permease [Oscillospiraceae bacterium]|nr:ABC transporter permease [Oscillospiraceae bacterium]
MKLFIGSLQLGLLYGILALGIYISFRILSIPDLTTEGSFAFGLSVSAAVTAAGHPLLALPASLLAGACAGAVTGILQTRYRIHPILSGIITMSGLYSINLMVLGGAPNLSLVRATTIFKIVPFLSKNDAMTVLPIFFAILCTAAIILFYHTHLGMCIRAVGDNEEMVRASSINVDACKVLAFSISNALIALSGAIIAQYQGYADISSSTGILVVGLASVIIGEAVFGRRGITLGFISAIVGSLVYRYIIALATRYSPLDAYMLRLVSAVIVGITLAMPAVKSNLAAARQKRGGAQDD